MGIGYVLFNGMRRALNPAIQPLTLARGIHAARDRFTPQYAHRHEVTEVTEWFRRAGFERMVIVDWKAMPPADHDDYRRNVGVRGTLPLSSAFLHAA
jgi:ribosomal protein L32E